MDWWVTQPGHVPVGPVSADLVVRGIEAGKIPDDALVCEVGGKSWRKMAEVSPFSEAVSRRSRPGRFEPSTEQTLFDPLCDPATEPPPRFDSLAQFDDSSEHTIADARPLRRSEPPRVAHADLYDERTIVEDAPLRPSEFPKPRR